MTNHVEPSELEKDVSRRYSTIEQHVNEIIKMFVLCRSKMILIEICMSQLKHCINIDIV